MMRFVALLPLVVLIVVACGGSTAPLASPVETGSIVMQNNAFQPSHITVPARTTVTWTNGDQVPHNVTFDDGGGSSDSLSFGATFQRVFNDPGAFDYECTIHPGMDGTVTVTERDRAPNHFTRLSSAVLETSLSYWRRRLHSRRQRFGERSEAPHLGRALHRPDHQIHSGGEELGGAIGELGRISVRRKAQVNRARDLGLVAPDLVAVPAEHAVELEPLGRIAREGHVPLVGPSGGGAQRAPAALAPDHEWHRESSTSARPTHPERPSGLGDEGRTLVPLWLVPSRSAAEARSCLARPECSRVASSSPLRSDVRSFRTAARPRSVEKLNSDG